MDVAWFYVFAVVPVAVGGLLWCFHKQVVWSEWALGSAVGLVMAVLFHVLASVGQTSDVETWSGKLVSGKYTPEWTEHYEEAVYRTEHYTEKERRVVDGKSITVSVDKTRRVFSHYEDRTRRHGPSRVLHSNIDTKHRVDAAKWKAVENSWKNTRATKGIRTTSERASRMIKGDPNDYEIANSGFIWPVTKKVNFENRVKATPTTFSYSKVPHGVNVFSYPENDDPFVSDRLIGSAALIDKMAFDQMNARLGPVKRVNVIMIGFGARDSTAAQWQEAAWVGGKKNDVVICWGGSNAKPDWARAFGWTEAKTCLRAIESEILTHGATTATLPLIEQKIKELYVLKDWSKFDYIKVPAPTWAVLTYFAVAVVSQAFFWYWAHSNKITKS